ncbi:hypothetical protein D3C75_1190140 [compost metagenome]
MLAVLLTAAEQQLHAQADAQQWLAASCGFLDYNIETAAPQLIHCIAKRANSGKNDTVGCKNLFRIARHQALITEPFHRFADTMQVAHAVIDDCNSHPTALPS